MTTIPFRLWEIKDNFKNECVLLRTISEKRTTMSRYAFVALLLLVAVLVVGAFLLRSDSAESIQASLALAEAMGGDTTGYARADAARPLLFPDDYGPHPGYKTEWWYYTGNLDTDEGRHFGYELTIFRFALAPSDTAAAERPSAWATNQLFMAHFALTDVASEDFYAFERFSRGALGLAGAQAAPYRVWLEDWSMEGGAGDPFPMRLRAAEDGVALDITLEAAKPLVLQGDRGLDQKGPEPGNASYYYSFTRLPTEGTIMVDGNTYTVRGLSWKDHEWSTSALGDEQVGWDWFALQLSDGRDLMYYQLRRRDGTPSPFTNGVLVAPDGTTKSLERGDVEIEVLDTWTSPRSAAVYPARWRFRIPTEGLNLQLTPHLPDQEMNVSVRYWEGAVRIDGTAAGEAVSGNGYVEMTGYGEGSDEERGRRGPGG